MTEQEPPRVINVYDTYGHEIETLKIVINYSILNKPPEWENQIQRLTTNNESEFIVDFGNNSCWYSLRILKSKNEYLVDWQESGRWCS
jgi:hypothetical protein